MDHVVERSRGHILSHARAGAGLTGNSRGFLMEEDVFSTETPASFQGSLTRGSGDEWNSVLRCADMADVRNQSPADHVSHGPKVLGNQRCPRTSDQWLLQEQQDPDEGWAYCGLEDYGKDFGSGTDSNRTFSPEVDQQRLPAIAATDDEAAAVTLSWAHERSKTVWRFFLERSGRCPRRLVCHEEGKNTSCHINWIARAACDVPEVLR